MTSMQNINPTILNAEDLPTRLRKPRSKESADSDDGSILFRAFTTTSSTLRDPFTYFYSDDDDDDTTSSSAEGDESDLVYEEPIDEQEIYDLISTISDPEHPISLGSLAVVSLPDIKIHPAIPSDPSSPLRTVTVLITPTITHCSLATVIGLAVRVRLEQSLPARFRVDVRIKEGTHSTADEVNKQLADKERVAAALENGTLMGVIKKMLETCR
ncbi:hypothetical protein VTN31DRAFT_3699 [Thermomyces dupontii]|uniref:uncharacterized protein n=1 Tax=Talaromyces thermophilus TaxID=28565 RepID=UPI003741F2A7